MFDIPTDLLPPDTPDLDFDVLPARDRKRGRSVYEFLYELHDHASAYTQAFLLMRFSMAMVASRIEEMREAMYDTVFPGWARIGGQAAVLSARNYWKALEALDGLPGSIPQWREAVDFGAFKEAKNAFGERFPEVDRARHSIAHPEFYPNPDMAMRPEGWQPPSLEDRYEGWWAYFDGVLVRCEVTEAGARFMAENAAKVFAAFEAIPRRAPAETGRPR